MEKERKAEEDLGRAEALRLAGLDYVETDRTYAAKLTEEMEQEEVGGSVAVCTIQIR